MVSQQQFLNHFSMPSWTCIFNSFEEYNAQGYSQEADLLYILADRGHPALIHTILRGNPGIDIQGESYGHTLLAAMIRGNKDSVAALLGLPSSVCDGIDITAGLKGDNGLVQKHNTPLSWACKNGHLAIADSLIQRGINVDQVDGQGLTCLMQVPDHGRVEVIQWLVKNGAAVNSKDKSNCTPLLRATKAGKEAVVQLLLDYGATIDSKDENCRTPLSWAARGGREDILQLLLDKGAAIDSNDKDGQTPLSYAAKRGHEALVRLLLEKGAATESKDKYGQTPLSYAGAGGHEATVQLLLDKGASVESRDNNGRTPLIWATRNGYKHGPVARLLESYGTTEVAETADIG